MTPEEVLHREARRAHRNPSEGQKAANNYRHGHVRMHGLHFAIENAKGSFRRGVSPDGKAWAVRMGHAYGYIKRHEGADGDAVDSYFGPHLKSPRVYIVDQHDPDTGRWDEHKVFLGFASKAQVKAAYHAAFSDGKGPDRLGHMECMSVDEFKDWLKSGGTTKPIKRADGGRVHFADGGGLMSDEDMGIASAPAAADSGAMLSDADMGIEAPAPEASVGSVLKQGAMGVGRGLLDIGGSLVDAATGKAVRDTFAGQAAADAAAPGLSDLVTGDAAGKQRAAYRATIAARPGTGQGLREGVGLEGSNAPQNALERIASGVGEGAAGAVLGGPEGILENMAVQGFAGGAGKTAAELAPEGYKGAADVAGNVLGGGAAALAHPAAAVATGAARRFAAPLTEEGQQTLAGKVLASRADDVDAVKQSLDTPQGIIPGSNPTTFQQTGDMGLGSLEREVATKNPADFIQRRADQNAARLTSLDAVQAAGDPAEVSSALRSQLDTIDSMTQRHVDDALVEAQGRAGALGGSDVPESYGETIRGAVQPRVDRLTAMAREGVEGLGGQGTPEAYGNTLRSALQDAETAARTHERGLWNAVDPDNSLTVGMQPIQQAARGVYGNMSAAAQASLKPVEKQILGVLDQYQAVEPFRELTDLRSLTSSALREELSTSGRTPTYARLAQLRGAIENSIDAGVQNRLAQEAEAVRAGQMQPEDTIAARLQREAAEFQSARQSARASATADAAERTAPFSSASRAEVPPSGGLRNAAGDQGVPAEPLDINFNDEAAGRLAQASAATRERAQTFGAQPLKPILRKEGQTGPYALSEASVPGKVFTSGPAGFDNVNRFLSAARTPAARQTLQDYAVASMRRSALRPDGTLDPSRFASWRRSHADSLRAFPELDQRMANVARASEMADSLAPFGNRSNATLPAQFFRPGPQGYEGVQHLRAMMGDEAARPVLEGYAASTLRKSAMTPEGIIDPAKFERWQATHADALRGMPDVAKRFSDAAKASEEVSQAAALRKTALESAQDGALGKIMGITNASDVSRTVGSLFGRNDSAQQMQRLVAQVQNKPEALNGLRRAVADHITAKLMSNTEAATTGRTILKADQFQTFVKNNRAALSKAFTPEQMNSLDAIARDIQRSNRSLNATKIPGQSNTAQDLTALVGESSKRSMLSRLLGDGGAALTGMLVSGSKVVGAAAGVVAHVAGALRASGLSKVDDLVKEAMLNPEIAKALLAKVPEETSSQAGRILARRLVTLLAASSTLPMKGSGDDGREPRKVHQ